MNKQTKTLLIVAVVAIIAIIYIYPRWNSEKSSGPASSSGPPAGATELPVTVITLKKVTLKNQLNVTGTILPNESVSLRPEVSVSCILNSSFNPNPLSLTISS